MGLVLAERPFLKRAPLPAAANAVRIAAATLPFPLPSPAFAFLRQATKAKAATTPRSIPPTTPPTTDAPDQADSGSGPARGTPRATSYKTLSERETRYIVIYLLSTNGDDFYRFRSFRLSFTIYSEELQPNTCALTEIHFRIKFLIKIDKSQG